MFGDEVDMYDCSLCVVDGDVIDDDMFGGDVVELIQFRGLLRVSWCHPYSQR